MTVDRAFDTQNIVLLHAYAGSGKTTTAAEFARWYALTGGVEVVLFTTFERYLSLSQVLGKIERIFGGMLEQSGIHYLALNEEQQRHVAQQIMQQVSILWIWDNVEPIAGFPTSPPLKGDLGGCPEEKHPPALSQGGNEPTPSPSQEGRTPPYPPQGGNDSLWSPAEKQELVDFLRSCRGTRAKFLLTSRRDERDWLGDLPRRIHIPKMPMRERVQLAKGIAEKHGFRLTEVEDWRPLLQFTQGNPLTITVLVGQALRDGLTTKKQIENFVAKLRAGEAEFEDEESEGRSKSLGASLQYGFGHAFTEEENKKLALLFFFQGFVDVDALRLMGDPDDEWCVSEVRNMTNEEWINLLDRAAEVGLLTQLGGEYYHIHPALPWYFKRLFERYYTPPWPPSRGESESLASKGESKPSGVQGANSPLEGGQGGVDPTRAFVEAMGELGDYYHDQYGAGNRDVIQALSAEEANLLHARQLARKYGWWVPVTSTMQGLYELYDHTGRRSEWQRLVEEIVPDFVDPATDGPLLGREEQWTPVMGYRVLLAEEAREWARAERLQRILIDRHRQQATKALALLQTPGVSKTPGVLDSTQRNQIRTLAVSLGLLGYLLREQGKSDTVKFYKEDLELCQKIGDQAGAAICAFNLGHAYGNLPDLRDLGQAEAWYRRSLELHAEGDLLGRARCLGELGSVVHERFLEAGAAGKSEEELLRHLNDALNYYHQALDMIPPNAVNDLAGTHNQLGIIYAEVSDFDHALPHWRESIRYIEVTGNLYKAGQYRYNIALALTNAGRFEDALLYAQAALRNYQIYGDRAVEEIQDTQELIAEIEEEMRKT